MLAALIAWGTGHDVPLLDDYIFQVSYTQLKRLSFTFLTMLQSPTLRNMCTCKIVYMYVHSQITHFMWTPLFIYFFAVYVILVPWPGVEPGPIVVEIWSPYYWTAREVPGQTYLICTLYTLILSKLYISTQ